MKKLLGALAVIANGTAVCAEDVGSVMICTYEDIELNVQVGAIDEMSFGTVLSVSAWPRNFDGPIAFHLPILEAFFSGCTAATDTTAAVSSDDFLDGYQAWKDAVASKGAGAFSLPPAEAYLTVLGVLP